MGDAVAGMTRTGDGVIVGIRGTVAITVAVAAGVSVGGNGLGTARGAQLSSHSVKPKSQNSAPCLIPASPNPLIAPITQPTAFDIPGGWQRGTRP